MTSERKYRQPRKTTEKVEKMAYLKHTLTDGEILKKKSIKSPNIQKYPIYAVNNKKRTIFYFQSENRLNRWKSRTHDAEDYEIVWR